MYILIEITPLTDKAKLKIEEIKDAAVWGIIDRLENKEQFGKFTEDFNLRSEIKQ